jgi:hypothetical protein
MNIGAERGGLQNGEREEEITEEKPRNPIEEALRMYRQGLRNRREIKRLYREMDVNLSGRVSNLETEIIRDMTTGTSYDRSILEELRSENNEWIENKWQSVSSYLTPARRDEAMGVFEGGLAKRIILESRTRVQAAAARHEETEIYRNINLGNREYLKEMATVHAFEFFRSIRIMERLGFSPDNALKYASNMHSYDPDKITTLLRDYPNEPEHIIIHFALTHSMYPEEGLDRYLGNLQRLRADPQFSNESNRTIERAAMSRSPEDYIRRLRRSR